MSRLKIRRGQTELIYTLLHINDPGKRIGAQVVVEKKVRITERFFDNHYKAKYQLYIPMMSTNIYT
jgi:hypothetical protein